MKNSEQPAFATYCGEQFSVQQGLNKREQACIQLGIPDTGDTVLDEIIRKAERKRIAAMAMQGILGTDFLEKYNPSRITDKTLKNYQAAVHRAITVADELLKQLELTVE